MAAKMITTAEPIVFMFTTKFSPRTSLGRLYHAACRFAIDFCKDKRKEYVKNMKKYPHFFEFSIDISFAVLYDSIVNLSSALRSPILWPGVLFF